MTYMFAMAYIQDSKLYLKWWIVKNNEKYLYCATGNDCLETVTDIALTKRIYYSFIYLKEGG